MKYVPGLTLESVFKHTLAVLGPDRLLFGSDSSFFPRGWVTDVYQQQTATLDALGVEDEVKKKIFGGNFDRIFANC
jgi:predicted TIM-barrel fold metal-dependent hydrolase